jgi:hypothetical protein
LEDPRDHVTKSDVPRLSIELVDFEVEHEAGNGEIDIKVSFEARILQRYEKSKQTRLLIRNLAAELFAFIHKNDFKTPNCSGARNLNAADDQIFKDFSGLESWLVTWEHTLRIGESFFKDWRI